MTSPIRISVPKIANAVRNAMAQEAQHEDHRRQRELEDTEACRLEMLLIDALPEAERTIANKQHIMQRGYYATHRCLGYILPQNLKWTVKGVCFINALLAKIPVTAPYMESDAWKADIAKHLEEAAENEERRAERKRLYDDENEKVLVDVANEIQRLIDEKNPMWSNYGKLFNYLRKGLPRYFGGARGVRVIHAAMRQCIRYADKSWGAWMDNDLRVAEERDAAYREAKKAARNCMVQPLVSDSGRVEEYSAIDSNEMH